MSPVEIANIVSDAASRYGVSSEALMAIADIESSGRVNAKNPSSSASGLFQFVDKTAREYGLTGSRRNDPGAQADAAARMMATNQAALSRVLGRQPTAGELYLAHQQGLGGASALLRNPNRPAVEVLTQVYGSREKAQNAIRLNGGSLNQSAGQFAGKWVNKANQRASLIPPGEIPNVVASRLDTTPQTRNVPRPQPRPQQRQSLMDMVRPRLTPDGSNIYSFQPQITPTSVTKGLGSLTPNAVQQTRPSAIPQAAMLPNTAPVPLPRRDPRMPTRMDLAAPPASQVRLPALPPSGLVPSSVVNQSIQKANAAQAVPASAVTQGVANARAATNPALAAAMAKSTIPAGMPVNKLSRDSVARAAVGAAFKLPNAIPGPAPIVKDQSRLQPNVYPKAPAPVAPLAPRQAVVGFPTPVSQRPQPVVGFPTPAQLRPAIVQPVAQPGLRIVVNGGNYSQPTPPQTFQGTNTGRTYTEGQRFMLGNDVVRANSNGGFTNERTGREVAKGTGWQALHGIT